MRNFLVFVLLGCVAACGSGAGGPPPAPPGPESVDLPDAAFAALAAEPSPPRFAGSSARRWAARLEGYPFLRGRPRRARSVDEAALEASRFAELRDAGPEALPILGELLVHDRYHGAYEAARDALLAQAKRDPGPVLAMLAEAVRDDRERVVTNSLEVLKSIGGPGVVPILATVAADRERPGFAYAAIQALRHCNADLTPATPVLFAALQSENEYLRTTARRALEDVGGIEVARELLRILTGHESCEVRDAAANALQSENIPLAAFAAEIVRGLRHPLPDVRRSATILLVEGNIRSAGAVPALTRTLRDEDPEVCWFAALALRELGEPGAVVLPALRGLLRDANPEIRGGAADLIGEIGEDAVHLEQDLIDALWDPAPEARGVAAWALAKLPRRGPGAVSAVLDALARERGGAHTDMVWALGEIGDPQAIPAIVDALEHESEYVRRAAFIAMKSFGPAARSAAPELARAMLRERGRASGVAVKGNAIAALGAVGGDVAVRTLVTMVAEDYLYGDDAAEALGAMGREAAAAVPDLVAELFRKDGDHAEEVGAALAKIGGEEALAALIRGLEADDWKVPTICAKALAGMGPAADRAVPALLLAIDDPHCGVASVVDALGKIGTRPESVVPALLTALREGNDPLRTRIAEALVSFAPAAADALPLLIDDVRSGSLPAIRLVGLVGVASPEMITALRRHAAWEGPPDAPANPVRPAAIEALERLGVR